MPDYLKSRADIIHRRHKTEGKGKAGVSKRNVEILSVSGKELWNSEICAGFWNGDRCISRLCE